MQQMPHAIPVDQQFREARDICRHFLAGRCNVGSCRFPHILPENMEQYDRDCYAERKGKRALMKNEYRTKGSVGMGKGPMDGGVHGGQPPMQYGMQQPSAFGQNGMQGPYGGPPIQMVGGGGHVGQMGMMGAGGPQHYPPGPQHGAGAQPGAYYPITQGGGGGAGVGDYGSFGAGMDPYDMRGSKGGKGMPPPGPGKGRTRNLQNLFEEFILKNFLRMKKMGPRTTFRTNTKQFSP